MPTLPIISAQYTQISFILCFTLLIYVNILNGTPHFEKIPTAYMRVDLCRTSALMTQ